MKKLYSLMLKTQILLYEILQRSFKHCNIRNNFYKESCEIIYHSYLTRFFPIYLLLVVCYVKQKICKSSVLCSKQSFFVWYSFDKIFVKFLSCSYQSLIEPTDWWLLSLLYFWPRFVAHRALLVLGFRIRHPLYVRQLYVTSK